MSLYLNNLYCYDYNLPPGVIYNTRHPASNGITYEASLSLDSEYSYNYIYNLDIYFLNSSKGYRYKISDTYYYYYNSSDLYVEFNLDGQTDEDADIDFIEFSVLAEYGEYVVREKIKVVEIQTSNRGFSYNLDGIKALESNLLDTRVKVAHPAWSTVRKNDLSNALKLTAPLHSTYSASYFKTNEYLRQAYTDNYIPLEYERIFLNQRPQVVIREGYDYDVNLLESNDINSSLKYVYIDENNSFEVDFFDVFLEPYKRNIEEVSFINQHLPSTLYFKKNKNDTNPFTNCIIKGIDENDDLLIETLLVRQSTFTKLQSKFKHIDEIDFGNEVVQISNYVSCMSDHYVISNPHILPPLVDSNFRSFKPLIKRESNNEYTQNVIAIYNPLSGNNNPVIKYNIPLTEDSELTSLFVDEDLNVFFTVKYEGEGGSALHYSKLNLDMTKNIFGDVTINNNNYISVSDEATNIGEWVDVNIKIQEWVEIEEDQVYIVQIKNGEEVYYYDSENNTITDSKVLNYFSADKRSELDFSLFVENENPYIISLIRSDFKNKVSAMSVCNILMVYNTINLNNNHYYLTIHNDELILNSINDSIRGGMLTDLDEESVYIIFDWKSFPAIFYRIEFNNYYIDNYGTNLNPIYYEYFNRDNENGGPVVLKIKKRIIEDSCLRVGASFNNNFGITAFNDSPISIGINGAGFNFMTESYNIIKDIEDLEYTTVCPLNHESNLGPWLVTNTNVNNTAINYSGIKTNCEEAYNDNLESCPSDSVYYDSTAEFDLVTALVRSFHDEDMQTYAAFTGAIEQLTGTTDWVLDTDNNQIKYTEKQDIACTTTNSCPEYQYLYRVGGIINYSSPQAACTNASSILTNPVWKGWTGVVQSDGTSCRFYDTSGGDRGAESITKVLNPDYDPQAEQELKSILLTTVAQKVISNATGDDEVLQMLSQDYITLVANSIFETDLSRQFVKLDDLIPQFETNKTLRR